MISNILLKNLQDFTENVEKLKEKKEISDEFLTFLDKNHSNISKRVLEIIDRGIIKYIHQPSKRELWVAIGKNDIYLIYPKIYCSCQDFYFQVIQSEERTKKICKHILAQIICEAIDRYKEVRIDDPEFKELIKDLKYCFK